MDRTKFFFLFPYADTHYFFHRLRDSSLIYYVSDKYNYIDPEGKVSWNEFPRGVNLLGLPREGIRYWLNLPLGKKEKFLPVWENYRMYGFFPHDSWLYSFDGVFRIVGKVIQQGAATLRHVFSLFYMIDWGWYRISLWIIFFLVIFLVVINGTT